MLDIVTMITNFCHRSSEMSEGISALMSPALQASRKACARFDTLLSNSPKASRSFRAGLLDDARPRNRHGDIGGATEQVLTPDDWRQHVVLGYAVLQRDDAGVRSDERRICFAADSVSRSFTEKITMSTLPMVAGSSVAFTVGKWIGRSPSSAMPFCRNASAARPRDERHVSPALLQGAPRNNRRFRPNP